MQKYSLRKFQPLYLRIWHWSNALVVIGLLGTVMLRKTFLSWRTNAALIEHKLKTAGTPISPDLAKDIAVAIRKPLWDWHVYLGFILGALLLARITFIVRVEKKWPGIDALKMAMGIKTLPRQEQGSAWHYSLVKLGYAAFYIVTILMVFTGVLMRFRTELGLPKGLLGSMKEFHETMMWFFVLFVISHLTGLVIAENGADSGLVSDMIHGGETKKK